MKSKLVVCWFRRDFRFLDNPALWESVNYCRENNLEFLPVFIFDQTLTNSTDFQVGLPRLMYLEKVLKEFESNFDNFVLFEESYQQVFNRLSTTYELHLFYNQDVEPYAYGRDENVTSIVIENGGKVNSFVDQLTVNPKTVSGSGNLYSVFTPFSKAVREEFINAKYYDKVSKEDLNSIKKFQDLQSLNTTILNLESKDLLNTENTRWELKTEYLPIDLRILIGVPNIDSWYYSETQVLDTFDSFLENKIRTYKIDRNNLELDGVSKMSVALKWGLISPRTLTRKVIQNAGTFDLVSLEGHNHYISELLWREFYRYIAFNHPNVFKEEFQPKYRNTIEWEKGQKAHDLFLSWIKGQTGYSLVDAAMNQIQKENWMHNRTRMVVASILTKNFGIDWRLGENYFRQLLLDLDESSNNGGWQWAASVGADPKPIRIFNPYLQAENYDKNFSYRRKWLPDNYNQQSPIIDHSKAREGALKRYNLGGQKDRFY